MNAPLFEPLVFPAWMRWKRRGGAFIDASALAVLHPDHRHYVRDERPADEYRPWRLVGSVRRCGWCARECPKRRRSWCSDSCSEKFYRVWSWEALAKYILERDGATCRRCGGTHAGPAHSNRYTGWEVDHIVPVRNGGTDDPSNLRLLCHHCHVAVGYEQRAAERPVVEPPKPPAQFSIAL